MAVTGNAGKTKIFKLHFNALFILVFFIAISLERGEYEL